MEFKEVENIDLLVLFLPANLQEPKQSLTTYCTDSCHIAEQQ